MKCLTYIDQIRVSFFTEFHAGLIPVFTKKQKNLTLSISRQNPFIRTESTVRRARMHCFLLFCVGTLPLLSRSSSYGKVVQNIIIKMCFYDLHISSSAQPSILMCNHKKNWQRAPSGNKKIQNEFIIHNKCRNVKHTTQLKQYRTNGL